MCCLNLLLNILLSFYLERDPWYTFYFVNLLMMSLQMSVFTLCLNEFLCPLLVHHFVTGSFLLCFYLLKVTRQDTHTFFVCHFYRLVFFCVSL